MTKWTNEQLEAITKSGSNIIVSAGAGSGKTAVLTERVINKLQNKVHLNELLILTFTNNAAFEMKTRIKKAIQNSNDIKEEIKYIDSADITTFDAYVLSLVKKYHYYLNLDGDLNIIDSSIIKKIKKDIINSIFQKLYEANNIDFVNLVLKFGNKNDKLLKKTILELDNKIDLITDKYDSLNNYVNNYYNIDNLNNLFEIYTNSLLNKIKTISNLLNDLSYEVNNDYYEKIASSLNKLLCAKSYDEIRNSIDIKLPPIRNTTEKGKYYKTKISDIVKDIKQNTIYSKDSLINNLMETKKDAELIINIITELSLRIDEYKKSNNVFEFGDISKLAIKLIKNNKDIREELKNKYQEIMIDEYQDTSDVQEEFINLIENNNVYMVGDVKQSIYRFRNANPDIFKIKYDNYKQNIEGIKIDLNKNFRSRKEVLNSINALFNHIMDNTIGNANYKDEHQLIFGNNSFVENKNINQNYNLEIYNYDSDNLTHSKDVIEAFIIANDIKDKLKNKYEVFDGSLRPCEYKDFCILMDRSTSFETYKKIFDYLKIPLNIFKDEDITLSEELLIINNIISLICSIKNNDDTKINFYYASIARSYLFRISDQEIYNNIQNNEVKSTNIYQICKEISQEIDYINNKELLHQIISKFGFYEKMITIGDTLNRTIIINNLLTKFSELNNIGINIYRLSDYITSLIEDNEVIKMPGTITNNNAVTITNIHKSKGLEYKICYYSGFYKEFNIKDISKRIIFDNQFGLILPYYNDGFISTFVSTINKEKYIKDEISEKLRLLYVALTRAKEKIIIVTSISKDEIDNYNQNEIVDYLVRSSYKSYNDVLESCYKYISQFIKDISMPQINPKYLIKETNNIPKPTNDGNKIIVNEIEENRKIINSSKYSKASKTIYNEKEIENMEYGTKIHSLLENIDFINPNLDLYTESEKNIISNFLSQTIFQNIYEAKIYKEYEFIYEKNNTKYHGIIDLMLEYSDHIDIIDYKLQNIDDPHYYDQLNGYKDYIENRMNKKATLYLYSLINSKLTKI